MKSRSGKKWLMAFEGEALKHKNNHSSHYKNMKRKS